MLFAVQQGEMNVLEVLSVVLEHPEQFQPLPETTFRQIVKVSQKAQSGGD